MSETIASNRYFLKVFAIFLVAKMSDISVSRSPEEKGSTICTRTKEEQTITRQRQFFLSN